MIIGIDPGTFNSAYVELLDNFTVGRNDDIPNEALFDIIEDAPEGTVYAIETPSPGAVWGHDLNETLWWAGRYYDRAVVYGHYAYRPTRTQIRLHLLGTAHGNDSLVRAAVMNAFCTAHGLDEKSVKGKKKTPGPLYGIGGSHKFAALAAALLVKEQNEDE